MRSTARRAAARVHRRRAGAAAAAAVAGALLLTGCLSADGPADPATGASPTSPAPSATPTAESADVRVVAVGDVVCDLALPDWEVTPTTCQHQATADLTAGLDPDLVLGLGDLQYEEGSKEQYAANWDRSWGQFSDRVLTVPGNHEWRSDLTGWRETFGEGIPAAHRAGAWGIYLLDATCDRADCVAEAGWLREQLAADDGRCQLVAWHQPRVSSGTEGTESVDPLWQAAVDGGADLVLNAHDHLYERFTRLGSDLRFADDGVRPFVVGTGGKSLYRFAETQPGSEVRLQDTFGVLELTLEPDAYAWRFFDIDDEVRDAGDDVCR